MSKNDTSEFYKKVREAYKLAELIRYEHLLAEVYEVIDKAADFGTTMIEIPDRRVPAVVAQLRREGFGVADGASYSKDETSLTITWNT